MRLKPGATNKTAIAGDRFAAINAAFGNGNGRTFFTTEEGANKEAHQLLTGQLFYPSYKAPDKLLIVKVLGVVERSTTTKRRKVRKGELLPTVEPKR